MEKKKNSDSHMNNKKSIIYKYYIKCFSLVVILIAIDQFAKHYIYNVHYNLIGTCQSNGKWMHIHPVFNKAGTYVSLRTGWSYDVRVVQVMLIVGLFAISYGFVFYAFKIRYYKKNGSLIVPFLFLIAAVLGRIIDRFFWEHTLDFISIRSIPVFNLIDSYGVIGVFLGILCGLYFSVLDKRETQKMTIDEKKEWIKRQSKDRQKTFGL